MANETDKIKNKLYKVSHTYIRKRDSSDSSYEIGGNCFDCGVYVVGGNFQAGHWIPDASGGALLRYHPNNMHGQAGGCNMKHQQERVKINYTMKMIEKYGLERVEQLRQLKQRTVKADIIFYTKLLELYEEGNEAAIINFLEGF